MESQRIKTPDSAIPHQRHNNWTNFPWTLDCRISQLEYFSDGSWSRVAVSPHHQHLFRHAWSMTTSCGCHPLIRRCHCLTLMTGAAGHVILHHQHLFRHAWSMTTSCGCHPLIRWSHCLTPMTGAAGHVILHHLRMIKMTFYQCNIFGDTCL